MGLFNADRFQEAYDKIKEDALGLDCSILIFVASDPDALCACKILQELLKTDYLAHKIVPVNGYTDLSYANQELIEDNLNIRSIVMLNCGGMVDLTEFLNISSNTAVYVFDSHRPLHLSNMFGFSPIVVFDDEDPDSLQHVQRAFEALEYAESDAEDSDAMEDDDDDETPNRVARQQRREYKQVITAYYSSGTHYGPAAALMMYTLASELDRTTTSMLWLSIVGVTSQYLQEHLDVDRYESQTQAFKDEVVRLGMAQSDRFLGSDHSDGGTDKEEYAIKYHEELRFMLFRHWSLYESMFHSSYVAAKLGIWREKGRRRLLNMLAKMGFSLRQCQQLYTHMDLNLKRTLRQQIEEVAPDYGLVDLCYGSFMRSYGYKGNLSASDIVYAITALLKSTPEVAKRLGAEMAWHDTTNEEADQDSQWMRSFYTAYDALDDIELVQHGLSLSMKLQQAVVRQGTSMIERHAIKTLKTFRFAVVKDGPDLTFFTHPATLSQLALFLLDAMREYRKADLPFVIAALNENQGTYMVVGVSGSNQQGDTRKNHFGLAFQHTAHLTGARCRHDSFETSVMEIKSEDLAVFMEHLHVRILQ
ncbi:CDC45-like protein [Basidiobolus meristosporus CBS 931.73]|uniref:CDC45-like protein n=1 Tax=Basidiobolus meristosporus CBS 931.73 TaxID=1314790 RepID=A0A1Y1YP06_9FUNG|nr:CDC45-like protein [Basidiobolus meristosporus CBS 931.73]|eukprot:ORX99770.1 CDC45-like protein [Basidiobolus meristosporus CBS 931.73]